MLFNQPPIGVADLLLGAAAFESEDVVMTQGLDRAGVNLRRAARAGDNITAPGGGRTE